MAATVRGLDCTTERGREWMAQQHVAARVMMDYHPHLLFIESPDLASFWDYIIADERSGKVLSICEVKSRSDAGKVPLTVAYMMERGYLITREKVDLLCKMAGALGYGVRPVLLVNLVRESAVMRIQLQNGDGQWIEAPRSDVTTTQDNCNGGIAVRENYFIPCTDRNCKLYRYDASVYSE